MNGFGFSRSYEFTYKFYSQMVNFYQEPEGIIIEIGMSLHINLERAV